MSDQANHPVAVITGASSGIGLASAELLLSAGYRVVLVGRSQERLAGAEQTLIERGGLDENIAVHPADVGDPAQAGAIIDHALRAFGRVDVLFNNAGVAPLMPIDQTDRRDIQQTFHTNAVGPAITIHKLWQHWVETGPADAAARRVIINTSSVATADPFPGFFAYAASKAAVELLAKTCANEGESLGVKAFAVGPGAVETPLLRNIFPADKLPEKACLAPQEVAQLVMAMVNGDHDEHNGQTLYIQRNREGGADIRVK